MKTSWVISCVKMKLISNISDGVSISNIVVNVMSHAGYILHTNMTGAGIAQSVWRQATGWTAKGSEFESQWGQEFSLLHIIQTGSGIHPASYPMGMWGSSARA
jgi:hypothetical protein